MYKFLDIFSAASYRSVTSTLRYNQKDRIILSFFDFETHVSAKIQICISFLKSLGVHRMLSTRGELFYWRGIDFVPHIKSLVVIKS